ncbi:hypothetical protein [Marinomonas shanghaiensis]|uniref:hypothetical protein n=1 Tax=Marinomonas shanghaiensis TaxID=2202418 RepID=UPI003A8CFA2A
MDNFTVYKREATVVATADIDMKKQYKRIGYIECGDFEVSSAEEAIELYNKKRSNLMSKSPSGKNNNSLVSCSDCSERISAKAKTCPHCGAKGISVVKDEKRKAIGCSILIAVPIFFFLVAVLSGGDEEEIAEKGIDDIGKQYAWMEKGKDSIKLKLKDPSSAMFKDVYFNSGRDGIPVTCGSVNSKNSFGGYTGYQRFISAGRVDLTFLESEVESMDELWHKLCL